MYICLYLLGMLSMLYVLSAGICLLTPMVARLMHISSRNVQHRDWELRIAAGALFLYLFLDWGCYYLVVLKWGVLPDRWNLFSIALDGLACPFFHLLTTATIKQRRISAGYVAAHLLPFVLLCAATSVWDLTGYDHFIYAFCLLYVLGCFVVDFRHVWRFRRRFEDRYAYPIRHWYVVRFGLPAMELMLLLYAFSLFLFENPWGGVPFLLVSIVEAVFIFTVTLVLIYESEDKTPREERAREEIAEAMKEPDEDMTTVSEWDQQAFLDQLHRECVETELYCQPMLHREELVRRMRTNTSYFSYRLKAATGKNFYTYINDLRLERAKELLLNSRDLTIDRIMRQVGFTSEGTFFRLFKQKYGCTPKKMRQL